jgi:hypothetical protein
MHTKRPEKSRPWLVEAEGVLDSRYLPDEDFDAQWEAIIVERALKDELLAQGVLNFTLRPRVQRAVVPLHGMLLLVGPPGTGAGSPRGSLEPSTGSARSATSRSNRTPWRALPWVAAKRP